MARLAIEYLTGYEETCCTVTTKNTEQIPLWESIVLFGYKCAENVWETRLGCCQSKIHCDLSITTVAEYLAETIVSQFIDVFIIIFRLSWSWDASSSLPISIFSLTKLNSQLFHHQFIFTLHSRTSGIVQAINGYKRPSLVRIRCGLGNQSQHDYQTRSPFWMCNHLSILHGWWIQQEHFHRSGGHQYLVQCMLQQMPALVSWQKQKLTNCSSSGRHAKGLGGTTLEGYCLDILYSEHFPIWCHPILYPPFRAILKEDQLRLCQHSISKAKSAKYNFGVK
jgi:hypothetical protein